MFSPYAAMGNAPESMVDPNGTLATYSSDGTRNDMLSAYAKDFVADVGGAGTGSIGGGGGGLNLGTGGYVNDNGEWVNDGSSFGAHRAIGANGRSTEAFWGGISALANIMKGSSSTFTNIGNGNFMSTGFKIEIESGSGLLADGGTMSLGAYLLMEAATTLSTTITTSAVVGSGGAALVLVGGLYAGYYSLGVIGNTPNGGIGAFEGSSLVRESSQEILMRQNAIKGVIALGEAAKTIYHSKGGNKNVWPDGQYAKPNPNTIDWSKGDQQLADEITGSDAPKGPRTPNNLIKKWFRDKRPK
jgi:hypothetical protein